MVARIQRCLHSRWQPSSAEQEGGLGRGWGYRRGKAGLSIIPHLLRSAISYSISPAHQGQQKGKEGVAVLEEGL